MQENTHLIRSGVFACFLTYNRFTHFKDLRPSSRLTSVFYENIPRSRVPMAHNCPLS